MPIHFMPVDRIERHNIGWRQDNGLELTIRALRTRRAAAWWPCDVYHVKMIGAIKRRLIDSRWRLYSYMEPRRNRVCVWMVYR